MRSFHITYFYLATGMEGVAETADYGIVQADTAHAAREIIAERVAWKSSGYLDTNLRDWMMGCLSAKEVILK